MKKKKMIFFFSYQIHIEEKKKPKFTHQTTKKLMKFILESIHTTLKWIERREISRNQIQQREMKNLQFIAFNVSHNLLFM